MRSGCILVALFLAGCTNLNYQHIRDTPPPAVQNDSGTRVSIIDHRPKWERKPFDDAMSLYSTALPHPNLWEQLRGATVAIIQEMPERPERIEIVIQSVQIVRRDTAWLAREAKQRQAANTDNWNENITTMLFAILFEVMVNEPLQKHYPKGLDESPEGVSCTIRADVSIIGRGGSKRVVPVVAIATVDSATKNSGDAIDEAVRLALIQYDLQLRRGIGAPDRHELGTNAVGVASGTMLGAPQIR